MTWTTLSTNLMRIRASHHPAVAVVSAIADCSVQPTAVTAAVAPARCVSTGCMTKVGYR